MSWLLLTEQPRRAEGLSPVEQRTERGFDYHAPIVKQLWQPADSSEGWNGRKAMQRWCRSKGSTQGQWQPPQCVLQGPFHLRHWSSGELLGLTSEHTGLIGQKCTAGGRAAAGTGTRQIWVKTVYWTPVHSLSGDTWRNSHYTYGPEYKLRNPRWSKSLKINGTESTWL